MIEWVFQNCLTHKVTWRAVGRCAPCGGGKKSHLVGVNESTGENDRFCSKHFHLLIPIGTAIAYQRLFFTAPHSFVIRIYAKCTKVIRPATLTQQTVAVVSTQSMTRGEIFNWTAVTLNFFNKNIFISFDLDLVSLSFKIKTHFTRDYIRLENCVKQTLWNRLKYVTSLKPHAQCRIKTGKVCF